MGINQLKKWTIYFVPIVITLFFVYIFGIRYAIVDDVFINQMTEGVYGTGKNQYMILPYLGIGFTYILYLIKNILSQFNIYLLSMYGLMTVSFIGLQYLFYKKYHSYLSLTLLILLQLLFLNYMTYTVVAYLVCFVGILYLFETETWYMRICALIVLLLGISIRKDVFLSLLIIFIPYCIYYWKKNKQIKIGLVICLLAFTSISLSNQIVLNSFPITKDYLKWNELSTQIRDYSKIKYDDYSIELSKKGISENDLRSLYSWMFADLETLGPDVLNDIVSQKNFFDTFELNPIRLIQKYLEQPMYVFFAVFSICFLWFYKQKNLLGLGIILVILMDMGALMVRQRVVDRVFIPIIFLGVTLLFYEFRECVNEQRYRVKISNIIMYLFIVILMIYGVTSKNWFKIKSYYKPSHAYNYVQEHKDNLFVFEGVSGMMNAQYTVECLKTDIQQYSRNVMTLGTWDTFSERYYSQLESFGIKNADFFIGHLYEYDNVYLMMRKDASKLDIMKTWYKEHKKIRIKYTVVDKVDHLFVYKVEIDHE